MSDRPSRKRKTTEESEQYRQGLMKEAAQSQHRKKMRVIRKQVDEDLSDLFGKMQATDEPRNAAVVDVKLGRGRRRKTRKASKKSRKTRKH